MVQAQAALIIVPALVLGAVIGVYEALVIHRDVQVPTHRFGHMIHALILSVIFVFVSMNVEFVLSLIPQLKGTFFGNPIVMQIGVGLLAAIKIHGVSAAIKGTSGSSMGMKETWFHSILVGALIVGAPYAYPLLKPILPKWAQ